MNSCNKHFNKKFFFVHLKNYGDKHRYFKSSWIHNQTTQSQAITIVSDFFQSIYIYIYIHTTQVCALLQQDGCNLTWGAAIADFTISKCEIWATAILNAVSVLIFVLLRKQRAALLSNRSQLSAPSEARLFPHTSVPVQHSWLNGTCSFANTAHQLTSLFCEKSWN